MQTTYTPPTPKGSLCHGVKSPMSAAEQVCDFIVTGFYSGYAPKAPGTCGTVAALVLSVALFLCFPGLMTTTNLCLLAALVTAVGIVSANFACKRELYGAGMKDPQRIVIDEFAGYFVALIGAGFHPFSFLMAFTFFRLFDITKPFPCKRLEKLPDGFGIVLDDVAAGIYALCLRLLVETLLLSS